MPDILAEIRYAFRVLRQSPGFTLTAVLTLALGLGGTTAIFTLIHAVMLRSLRWPTPQRCTESAMATIAAWKAVRRIGGACTPIRSTTS